MNLINDIEKRIQLTLQSLQKELADYKNIECNVQDQKKIKKIKQSIQQKNKNQLKQQTEIQNFNRRLKAKLDLYTQEYAQSIKNQKKNIELLKQNMTGTKNQLKALQKLKNDQEKLSKDIDELANALQKKREDYKISQQKTFKTKQELNNMDIHFFNLVNQNEQMLQQQTKYFQNLKIVKQYQYMKKIKNKIIEETDKMNDQYSNLADKKLQQLVNVRNNIGKIHRIHQEIQKQLYQQRYFLGLKQRYSQLDSIQLEEQQHRLYLQKQNQQDIKNKFRREYEQMFLSPQPMKIKWQPFRRNLKSYLDTRKQSFTNKLKKQNLIFRPGSSNHFNLKNNLENSYNPIQQDSQFSPINHLNQNNKTEPVYEAELSYHMKKNKFTNVSFKDTGDNLKMSKQYIKQRQHSNNKLKDRIREYLKNKQKNSRPPKNSYKKLKNLNKKSKYKEDTEEFQSKNIQETQEIDLISVDSKQNDPNQEYIEVEVPSQITKKD